MSTLAERQAEFCSYLSTVLPMRSCAAIGGNGTQESLCQPVTLGPKDHGSDGVLQWRLERLNGPDGLITWCHNQEIPWDTLRSQALFTLHELMDQKYAVLLADLKVGTKSLETLTLNFCDAFERPSAAGRRETDRIRYAHDCLAIMMRDVPGPFPVPIPSPSAPTPPIGDLQMPIELIIQLVAPLAESLVAGLLKGALAHAQQTGTLPRVPAPGPLPGPSASLPPIDFAKLAQLIAAELAALNAPKPAA